MSSVETATEPDTAPVLASSEGDHVGGPGQPPAYESQAETPISPADTVPSLVSSQGDHIGGPGQQPVYEPTQAESPISPADTANSLASSQGDHIGGPAPNSASDSSGHHTGLLGKIKSVFENASISGSGDTSYSKSNYETVTGNDFADYGQSPPVVDHNVTPVVEEPEHEGHGVIDKIKHALGPPDLGDSASTHSGLSHHTGASHHGKSDYNTVTGDDIVDYGRPGPTTAVSNSDVVH